MIQPGKVASIARVNLVRQVRDRTDLFFVFVLPTIIILALGLQFGGASRARIGVVAISPEEATSIELVRLLREDPMRLDVREYENADELRSLVERGQLEAGVILPGTFEIELYVDGDAEVTYLGTSDALTLGLRAPVEAAVARIAAQATAARIVVGEGLASLPDAQAAAAEGYGDVAGVTIDVEQVGDAGLFAGFSQFTFGASTQLVLFMFLTSMTAAGRLVHTKQLGVSRRMVSTPTSMGTIITGEAIGRLGIALLQAAYIVAVTSLVFGVAWGDPLAAGALIVAFGVVAAGAAMLVGALSTNPDQASSLGVFAGLALGALGGCMIPYQVMPDVMQQLSRFIPHSWALLGLQSLVRDGGGIASVALNLAVLALFGVGLMGLAAWRFRRSIAG